MMMPTTAQCLSEREAANAWTMSTQSSDESVGWTLDIALPDHLEEFRPLQSEELHDILEALPHHLASCLATLVLEHLRGMQVAWRWFHVRNYDLQQYFRTLRHVIRHYPPTSRLCHFSETTHQDYSFLDFLFRDVTSRFDASAECLIWEQVGLHLPTWQILLRPARIEGLHE